MKTTASINGINLKKPPALPGKNPEMVSIKVYKAQNGKRISNTFPGLYSCVTIFKPLRLPLLLNQGKKKPTNTSIDPQKAGDRKKSLSVEKEYLLRVTAALAGSTAGTTPTCTPQNVQNLLSWGICLPQLEQYIISSFKLRERKLKEFF